MARPPRSLWQELPPRPGRLVTTDGMVSDGTCPEAEAVLGGFSIVDVPSREEALESAARFAVACRCAQEVREIGYGPDV